jgi:hypothetical protein
MPRFRKWVSLHCRAGKKNSSRQNRICPLLLIRVGNHELPVLNIWVRILSLEKYAHLNIPDNRRKNCKVKS